MRYRLVADHDLPDCLALLDLDGRCALSPRVRAQLPALWSDYLAADRHHPKPFVLWEDVAARPQPRLEALAVALFVPDPVYDALLSGGRPGLAEQLYTLQLEGRQVLLDARRIALANAGPGLSVVLPHCIQRAREPDLSDGRRLLPLLLSAWAAGLGGFQVRRILVELHGQPSAAGLQRGGFELRAVYAAASGSPPDCAPHWCEIDRDRLASDQPGALPLWLMPPLPPQLGLRLSQQAVALHALQGHTDRAIAALLGISADAVKQAWRGILAAATSSLPELLGAAHPSGPNPVRGAEHRRIVIEYLRQHMEELRPWPRRSRQGGP
ncbi:MAG: hypothetical protein RJA44_1957 [Pseudomonadota bacterium]